MKQRRGCLANVELVSEETHPAFPCRKETVGLHSQSCWMVPRKHQPDPPGLGCMHRVHAAPQKAHTGRWAKFKAPCGRPMFSIHPSMLDSMSHKVDHTQADRDCAKGSVPIPCTSPATPSASATTPLLSSETHKPWLCLIK